MDWNIPIPIRIYKRWDYKDFECICKYCSHPEQYITEWDGYSHLWKRCVVCETRVWHYHQICSLYSRRTLLVCFYCRVPFYKQGIRNGELHKIVKSRLNE